MKPPVKSSWFYTAPRWLVLLAAIASGFAVFSATTALELWLRVRKPDTLIPVYGSNALAGLILGVAQYTTLRWLRRRRAMVVHRLQVIAEMNHHVRNALELITLSTATMPQHEATKTINEATQRISWALKEILGSEPEND